MIKRTTGWETLLALLAAVLLFVHTTLRTRAGRWRSSRAIGVLAAIVLSSIVGCGDGETGNTATPAPGLGIVATPLSTQLAALYQLNSGGAAVSPFAADQFFSGGSTYTTSNAITTAGVANAAPAAVYQSERYGNFSYTIGGLTAGAPYTVRLHFAEIYWTTAGARVFNVSINGAQALTNFDIFAAAGVANTAVAKDFSANANSSGQLVIQYVTVKDNAKSSGIEVLAGGGGSSPTGPAITSQPVSPTVAAGQTATFAVAASGTAPLLYQWQMNGSSISGATGASYTTPATAAADSGSTFRVIVSNSVGSVTSNSATLTVTSSSIAINSGGTSVGAFAADADSSGGQTFSTAASVNVAGVMNPAPEAVYQSERWGAFTYTIPGLAAGASYTVRLHFAEIYWSSTGQRLFNVAINGTTALSNFDIVAAAGGSFKAVVKEFTVTASSTGLITIGYTQGSADWPKSSGIEVIPLGGNAATGDGGAVTGGGADAATSDGGAVRSYTTHFPLTESPISEAGAWTNVGLDWTNVVTASNRAYGTHVGTGYNDSYAHLSGFPPDVEVSAVIYLDPTIAPNYNEVEIHLRWADSAHVARGYECGIAYNGAYGGITRWNGALGDFTSPSAWQTGAISGGVHDGDTLSAQIVGNIITLKLNGVVLVTADITTAGGGSVWTDGNPGMGFYNGDAGHLGFKSYSVVSL